MDRISGGEGGGVLIRTGPHSTVNDYASLWQKKWSVGESENPSEEGQLQANPHTQGLLYIPEQECGDKESESKQR
jgi:hypothetical protein